MNDLEVLALNTQANPTLYTDEVDDSLLSYLPYNPSCDHGFSPSNTASSADFNVFCEVSELSNNSNDFLIDLLDMYIYDCLESHGVECVYDSEYVHTISDYYSMRCGDFQFELLSVGFVLVGEELTHVHLDFCLLLSIQFETFTSIETDPYTYDIIFNLGEIEICETLLNVCFDLDNDLLFDEDYVSNKILVNLSTM